MKNLRILFFCILSGTTEFVTADIWVVPEGGNVSLLSYFTVSGSTKFFCKEKCERAEDILIKTDGTTAQSGRYSIEYMNASSGRGKLTFTITHMTKSDSGMYRFGLGKSLVPDSYSDIEARVSNDLDKNSGVVRAQTVGGEIQFPCANAVYGQRKFLCKNRCETAGEILIDTMDGNAQIGRYSIKYIKGSAFALYATITNLTKSDTGKYRCGYGNPLSPDFYYNQDIFVIDGSNPPTSTPQTTPQSFTSGISTPSSNCSGSSLPLVACVSLVGVLLLVVVLLLLYIFKMRRNAGLNTRENTNMEFSATYENWGPTSKHEDFRHARTKPTP